jgi:putative MATE family efflux protein
MNNYLAEEKIGKLLLKFSIPCILSLLISSLYNIVDQIFIGHGVGYLGNGATNVVFPLTLIALSLALFIGDGTGAFLSICLGKKEYDPGKRSVGSAIAIITVTSVLLTLLYIMNRDDTLNVFGATEANMSYAVDYFNYIMIGLPFFMFATAVNSIIRADGNPGFAMLSMVVGALINVILDALFIFVFKWGMMGAGLATSLGQIISAVVSLTYLFKMNAFKLSSRDFIPNRVITSSLPLGISSLITQISIVITLGFTNNALVTYGALSKYGSDIPLTAFGIVFKVLQIFISVVVGIAIGSQPIVGFNLGARKYDRIKQTYFFMLRAEIIFGLIATLACELFPNQIISLFGTDNALYKEFGVLAFRLYLCLIIFSAIQKSSSIFLQALGKPVLSMSLSLLRDVILIIPLVIILTDNFGVEGILYTAPIADFLALIITVIFIQYIMRHLSTLSSNQKDEVRNKTLSFNT